MTTFEEQLRWVGDLDHPFYQDERQRFVWYEASTIGLQLVLALDYVIGGILLLVVGAQNRVRGYGTA